MILDQNIYQECHPVFSNPRCQELEISAPYRIEREISFYERYEVQVVLHYLWLIQNPHGQMGDEALCRVINVPNRYIGHMFVNELKAYAEEAEEHLYAALKFLPIDKSYLRKNVEAFTDLMDRLIEQRPTMEPVHLISTLRESLELDHHFENDLADPENSSGTHLDQLQTAAGKFSDLQEFLYHAEFLRIGPQKSKEGVRLMTIHKAKGLEFKAAFLIGLVDGVFPNAKGDIEEERRIAFVGMSRAMELLYVSWSATHMGRPAKPSPFIEEMQNSKEVITK